jgi:uncharacterized protein
MAQTLQRGRRRWVLIALGAIVLALIVLSAFSGFYVDLLWFREVGFSDAFWRVYWTKILLGLIFGILFFILLLANLMIARRLTPRFRPFSPEQELIERYRAAFEPRAQFILVAFSAIIALFVGIAASGQWQTFLLWRSSGDVSFPPAQLDPQFHRNPAFYIFTLPFYQFLQGWLFSALVGILVIVAVAHYLQGGIRTQSAGEKVTPQVKAHLSVLLGLIVLVKAWGYYLGRFDLLVSRRGVVVGASYTDVHAQLPALTLLVFIAIACSVLFLVNIRFRGWALPVLGIGLLAMASIVAGAIYPAAVQKFSVDPNELQRESPYIERNIDATRYAFSLDQIQLTPQDVTTTLTQQQVDDNQATVDNVRVWNPGVLRSAYEQLQRFQPYYEFQDVDVDRYSVSGDRRVVMLSPREVSQNQIPGAGATWQNKHLVYTHGYAAVASQVNTSTAQGAPAFILQDIPVTSSGIEAPTEEGSQIYFGERADVPYVIVGGEGQQELNYPNPTGQGRVSTQYQGSGGISIGSFWKRLVFAYRYRDINILISGQINSQSKILINRDILTRVHKAAPFLQYDSDPYAAIIDGRLTFIWDAYTTSTRYPYSQYVDPASATGNPTLGGASNYIRNSVKAVVDAYDGTVRLYVVDPTDPLIQVWMNAFPTLFTSVDEASQSLRDHFRYPENLLQVQATSFSRYHVTDVPTFYANEQFWSIPPALAQAPDSPPSDRPMAPYYVLLKLPDQDEEEFVLFQPLTPFNRPNMVAYLAARSDLQTYGDVAALEFQTDQVAGPAQVRAVIDNDPNVAAQITLLGQQGSKVIYGDLLIVPIEDSFLYVQPIFVESSQVNAIPELKRVAIVNGGAVTLAPSLQEAIDDSFGGPSQGGGEPPPTGGDQVSQLLAQADQHFQAAEAALRNGDLATYQREINLGVDLVEQAQQLAAEQGDGTGGTPSPTPSPTPTPSTSPTG